MSKDQIQRKSKKVAISTKLAIKICEPYMNQVLRACYDLRFMAYELSYSQWCDKVNELLKENLERKEFKKC